MPTDGNPRSTFITAHDGLRLHVREYGLHAAAALPVVCLPGLTRTVADFEMLAPILADERDTHRRVIAVDSRGRGQSEHDREPANYNLAIELDDVETVLASLVVGPAVFVGSSRGGLLTMLLGATNPTAIAGVVLHDIGPVIELEGLLRIKSYVGRLPQPHSFADGADILRRLSQAQFPKLSTEQWLATAHRTWQVQDGALRPTYDVQLARTLAGIEPDRPPPPLWNEFDALSRVPLLVIRGANSDVLSAATVTAMAARHPGMQYIEIADQGHVPLLEGKELLHRIGEFVAKCDGAPRNP